MTSFFRGTEDEIAQRIRSTKKISFVAVLSRKSLYRDKLILQIVYGNKTKRKRDIQLLDDKDRIVPIGSRSEDALSEIRKILIGDKTIWISKRPPPPSFDYGEESVIFVEADLLMKLDENRDIEEINEYFGTFEKVNFFRFERHLFQSDRPTTRDRKRLVTFKDVKQELRKAQKVKCLKCESILKVFAVFISFLFILSFFLK